MPLVQIMSKYVSRKNSKMLPKSNEYRLSLSSSRGSPRCMISRSACDRGVKKICKHGEHYQKRPSSSRTMGAQAWLHALQAAATAAAAR